MTLMRIDKYDDRLHKAAISGNIQDGIDAIRSGANINEVDYLYKATPLHTAIARESFDFARWLLQQPGLDLTIQDRAGRTPGQMAHQLGYFELAIEIKRIGASQINPPSPT